MTINFNLEKIRETHNCRNYFETGLWDPRLSHISTYKALSCNFKTVHCIEIREDWVSMGKEIFKQQIEDGKYNLYRDDSTNMGKYLSTEVFENKTIFFLDAHVDNVDIHNFKYRCPLFDELTAIGSIERKDNIILVDDLRIIKRAFPWGEQSFGNIDFLEKIKQMILDINKDYKFKTLDGVEKDDVLYAYV